MEKNCVGAKIGGDKEYLFFSTQRAHLEIFFVAVKQKKKAEIIKYRRNYNLVLLFVDAGMELGEIIYFNKLIKQTRALYED